MSVQVESGAVRAGGCRQQDEASQDDDNDARPNDQKKTSPTPPVGMCECGIVRGDAHECFERVGPTQVKSLPVQGAHGLDATSGQSYGRASEHV